MFWKRNKKQSYTVLMDMDLDTLVSAESELGPVVFAFTDQIPDVPFHRSQCLMVMKESLPFETILIIDRHIYEIPVN